VALFPDWPQTRRLSGIVMDHLLTVSLQLLLKDLLNYLAGVLSFECNQIILFNKFNCLFMCIRLLLNVLLIVYLPGVCEMT